LGPTHFNIPTEIYVIIRRSGYGLLKIGGGGEGIVLFVGTILDYYLNMCWWWGGRVWFC